MRPEDIDKLSDEELKERLMVMSPEAADQYRNLNGSVTTLLELNLREMTDADLLVISEEVGDVED